MASLNKVILIGRLGRDPEVTTFENGNKKVTMTLATSERYRDREGNWVEQTDWHNLVIWNNLANDIADHRRNYCKGDLMYVEGKLRTRQYTDQQGSQRYVTEIIVDKIMQMAPGKNTQQPNIAQRPPETPSAEAPVQPIINDSLGQPTTEEDLPF